MGRINAQDGRCRRVTRRGELCMVLQTQARTLQGEMDRAKEAAASAKAIAESAIAEMQEALSTMRIELDQTRHANEVLQKEVRFLAVESSALPCQWIELRLGCP